jgi:hypothetical protein
MKFYIFQALIIYICITTAFGIPMRLRFMSGKMISDHSITNIDPPTNKDTTRNIVVEYLKLVCEKLKLEYKEESAFYYCSTSEDGKIAELITENCYHYVSEGNGIIPIYIMSQKEAESIENEIELHFGSDA